MNYIDIDLFGGIVSNADSEDIRQDVGQNLVNFDVTKIGLLKPNDEYKIALSIDGSAYDSLFYWIDFSNGDTQKIIFIDDDNNVRIAASNYSFDYFQFRDVTDSSNNQLKIGAVSDSTSVHKSMHHFNSDGNLVRIIGSSSTDPKLIQHINDRDFWGYNQSTTARWNSLKSAVGGNSYVLSSSNSGYFMDIAYPRNNYIKGVFRRSEYANVVNDDFEVKTDSKAVKDYLVRSVNSASPKVTDNSMVGNITYDSATANTSFYTHEYALALMYDGTQVGPLGNSSFTRIRTVDSQTRNRPRGMGARVNFRYNIGTNEGNTATFEHATYNPRVTGFSLYRAPSPDNYIKTKSRSALRRVGTYRIDRSEADMKRVSVSSSDMFLLTYEKMITLDSSRYSSSISSITSTHFKFYVDNTGDSDLEEYSIDIDGYDDAYGCYSLDVIETNYVPDYFGSWAITQNSAAIGSGAGTIYNSGLKAIGGEMWVIVPGDEKDGDGRFKNCIISEQSNASNTKFDCIVESHFGRHTKSDNTVVYYHACRLAGDSLWDEFKANGLTNVYIYETNEPIYWRWSTDNQDDSNEKTTYADIFIYDTDPISFEGHPYPNDRINHGYEVSHMFMGRRFAGDVTLYLGDPDEEVRKNFVLYSEVGMPDVFPSANFLQITSDLGGRIIGFSDIGGDLIIFTSSSIHSLNMRGPNPDSWVLSTVSNKIGCVASDSILKVKDRIFFAGDDSCYYLSAQGQLVPISEPINDMYRELPDSSKKLTKTMYRAKKGIVYWHFGPSNVVGGTYIVYELHLTKGDVTWTSRNYQRLIDKMVDDFNNEPAFFNSSVIVSNPLAR
jgi:hypothetical protein